VKKIRETKRKKKEKRKKKKEERKAEKIRGIQDDQIELGKDFRKAEAIEKNWGKSIHESIGLK
jgi:hypothetical protein